MGACVQTCVGEVSYKVASVKWVTLIINIFSVGPKLSVVSKLGVGLKLCLGQNVDVQKKNEN